MLGAGVFVVFSPAAALAGSLLTVSVALAGVVAYCNAVASAQLAARYPASGGATSTDASSSASGRASSPAGDS